VRTLQYCSSFLVVAVYSILHQRLQGVDNYGTHNPSNTEYSIVRRAAIRALRGCSLVRCGFLFHRKTFKSLLRKTIEGGFMLKYDIHNHVLDPIDNTNQIRYTVSTFSFWCSPSYVLLRRDYINSTFSVICSVQYVRVQVRVRIVQHWHAMHGGTKSPESQLAPKFWRATIKWLFNTTHPIFTGMTASKKWQTVNNIKALWKLPPWINRKLQHLLWAGLNDSNYEFEAEEDNDLSDDEDCQVCQQSQQPETCISLPAKQSSSES
jgi:hypothetical protein